MIQVKFYKKSYYDWGKYEMLPVEFVSESDDFNVAYEEALQRGHNPNKRIEMKHIESYSPLNSI